MLHRRFAAVVSVAAGATVLATSGAAEAEGFAPPQRWSSSLVCQSAERVRIGDVDGDGRDDVVCLEGHCAWGQCSGNDNVALSTASGFGSYQYWSSSEAKLVGDFDGDTKDDLAQYGYDDFGY